jgi:tetratricopeptide (TPR) repeat protein
LKKYISEYYEGLKHFLIELTQGPVRFASGKVGKLEDFERLNYLYQNRFWNEARRLLEDRLEETQNRRDLFGKMDHAKGMNLLGQIQTRQGDYQASIKTWSLYIELFNDVVDTRPAMENLADGLSKLRYHRSAGQLYGQLAVRPGVDPVIRWHHFWNLYLGGDFTVINTLPRLDFAAINLTTKSLEPLAVNANGNIEEIEISGDTLIVGGSFSTIGGISRSNLRDPTPSRLISIEINHLGVGFQITEIQINSIPLEIIHKT